MSTNTYGADATWDELDAIVAEYRLDNLSALEIAGVIWELRRSSGPSDRKDAERWREHVKIIRAATLDNALLMRLTMNQDGKAWSIEYVLDVAHYGKSLLGIRAIGLAAEHKATELFEAMDSTDATVEKE